MSGIAFTGISAGAPSAPARPVAQGRPRQKFSEVLSERRISTAGHVHGSENSREAGLLERMEAGRRRLDQIIELARKGKSFTPQQLLALQAEMYSLAEQFSLATKAVEQVGSSMKRLWQMQV